MYCVQNVTPDIFWVGGSDRRIALFENIFPLTDGVMYNSYLIVDEKTVLMDTVDRSVTAQFFENVEHALAGRKLDYLVVNHMEPDHCFAIGDIVRRWPEVQVVGNKKTFQMMNQFFQFQSAVQQLEVIEGDSLSIGKHTLNFYLAPFVHWPEAMVTYESETKTLFAADAFGSFGGFSGNLFADQVDFDRDWLDDARRYYTNIVGKYGQQVQTALKKLSGLDIARICPLHGLIWREDLGYILNKYNQWSSYTPETEGVVIAYASMYGDTENAAHILAGMLSQKGIHNIRMFDVSKTHPSYIIAEIFKNSHLVIACPTYNLEIYPTMELLLTEMKMLNVQKRKVALIANGTWAPRACKLIMERLEEMKMEPVCEPFTITSGLKDDQVTVLQKIADDITASFN